MRLDAPEPLQDRLDPHADQPVLLEGTGGEGIGSDLIPEARALLLLHGRGATAQSILDLGRELSRAFDERAFVRMAPQAAKGTWYPGSFLEPIERNEPWLSSALQKIERCSQQLEGLGIPLDRQVLVGFSQGACLATEFVVRRPRRYGGLLAFTGGILGPLGQRRRFQGDLAGTPVLFSTGDPDPHVPWIRVQESADTFRGMGARVELDRYPGRPHTIAAEEIRNGSRMLDLDSESNR